MGVTAGLPTGWEILPRQRVLRRVCKSRHLTDCASNTNNSWQTLEVIAAGDARANWPHRGSGRPPSRTVVRREQTCWTP